MATQDFDQVEYDYLYNISPYLAHGYLKVNVINYRPIMYMALFIPTAFVAFIGNVIVLTAFVIDRKQLLKVHFNLFIVNRSIIDLLVAVADMPFTAILGYRRGYWPKQNLFGCSVVLFDDWILTLLSMMTLVGISIDRYWAECWSQHYRNHNTRAKTLIFIGCIWFEFSLLWIK